MPLAWKSEFLSSVQRGESQPPAGSWRLGKPWQEASRFFERFAPGSLALCCVQVPMEGNTVAGPPFPCSSYPFLTSTWAMCDHGQTQHHLPVSAPCCLHPGNLAAGFPEQPVRGDLQRRETWCENQGTATGYPALSPSRSEP